MKNERLEEIRLELGLSKTQLASLMGIKSQYYSGILQGKGKANLRMEHLESLMERAGVNPVWVLTGEGDKFLHSIDAELAVGEPSMEEVEALYEYIVEKWPHELTLEQVYAVKLACAHVFVEHPEVRSMDLLAMAAVTYMKVIYRVPDVNLTRMLGLPEHVERVIMGDQQHPDGAKP